MAFDHTVHHRDAKTGKIVRVTPYSLECNKDVKIYRRDGKCYDAAGVEIADPKLVKTVAAPAPAAAAVQGAPSTAKV